MNTHRLLGNVDSAVEALFKSSEAAKKGYKISEGKIKDEFKEGEAISYISIADLYSEVGNSNNAEIYYNKGIALLREMDEPRSLASALFNAGDEFFVGYLLYGWAG